LQPILRAERRQIRLQLRLQTDPKQDCVIGPAVDAD